MVQEDRLVERFLQLCKINAPSLGEADSVAWTKAHLESLGLEVWEDDAGKRLGGNANNLIAVLRGNLPGAPKIFLSAHFDTVEPTAGLVIEEQDGAFFSDGSTILGADDKAGMAPAIEAVLSVKESGEAHGDVYLLFSVAEEIGLKGAAELDILSLGLDFGFVLDTGPPVGSFVTRTAFHDNLEVTIKGRPAHAGKDPEKGLNAIQVAAAAISGMKLGRIGPETTANIGIIQGGTAVNVVCPEVLVRAEARSTSAEELDAQIAHMVNCFEVATAEWGANVDVVHHRHYRSYDLNRESEVVQVARAASRNLGLDPELRTTLGGSDANIYNAAGVPTVVVGTGMEKIHTHEETVSREALVQTARLAEQLIVGAAKRQRA